MQLLIALMGTAQLQPFCFKEHDITDCQQWEMDHLLHACYQLIVCYDFMEETGQNIVGSNQHEIMGQLL